MADSSEMLARLRHDYQSSDKDFKLVRILGEGAFGRVGLFTVQRDKMYANKGDCIAIKRIKRNSVCSNADRRAKKEAMALNKLGDHEFIVRYLDNFKDAMGQLCIVMEYCNLGTLEDWLSKRNNPLPEYQIWRLIMQFSSALSFLHGQHPPILHNDLKPANILCTTQPHPNREGTTVIKIADFGVSNVLGQTSSAMYYHANPNGGTPIYLAPEVLRGNDRHIKTSADMWSIGAVIVYVANDREHLFRSEMEVLSWRALRSPMRRYFKYPELHTLVLSLLFTDKNLRPTAGDVLKEVKKHPNRSDFGSWSYR